MAATPRGGRSRLRKADSHLCRRRADARHGQGRHARHLGHHMRYQPATVKATRHPAGRARQVYYVKAAVPAAAASRLWLLVHQPRSGRRRAMMDIGATCWTSSGSWPSQAGERLRVDVRQAGPLAKGWLLGRRPFRRRLALYGRPHHGVVRFADGSTLTIEAPGDARPQGQNLAILAPRAA